MVTQNWLYDAILYVYALSLLFYFSDFMDANRRAKRIGTGLLIFVWVLQTLFLLLRMISHFELESISRFEYWLVFSWLIVTISIVVSRFINIEFFVFLVNVIGFAVLALNLYSNPGETTSLELWHVTRDLLYVHISLVLCAYAALIIGAIFSGMYLFMHRQLKDKQWSRFVRRLPSLSSMENYTYRMVLIGLPLLAMSLSVAVTSLLVEGHEALLLDWKVLSSFAALLLYIVYMLQRTVWRRPGPEAARVNLLACMVLIINLFTNSISSFH
ncbi:inner membrane protein YpjD [Paenibacillus sp. GCM10023252]|uniref:cytochrome C assembly family protein n=1 Tax=Paenibacillus sp. GCM10023252 TaxID=3252649 RepID=UPI00361B1A13